MNFKIKKMSSVEEAISKVGNICLYAFLILTSYIFLYRYDHTMFILRYVFLIGGALTGYVKCLIGRQKFNYPILFLASMALLWLMTTLGQETYQNYSASDFLYTACYIGIAVLILNNEYSHIISLILYGFTSISILLRVFQGIDKNLILLANSRNYISILLLSTLLLYYISCNDKKKPILVTPILIYFYISIYATGRSGIIVSGFMAVSLLVYKYTRMVNKKSKVLMGFLIAFVLLTMGFYLLQLNGSIIESFLKRNFVAFFQRGTDSNGRNEIWGTFIQNNKNSLEALLFGSNTFLAMTDGNLHNSFLQIYASFGVFGFITLIALLIRALFVGIQKKQYLWLIFFCGLMLRALTDRVFFQGYCELYLYYFIFYFAYQRKNEINPRIGDNYVR